MQAIKTLQDIRPLAAKVLDHLSPEQLLYIPQGFNNNILWNLGHVVVTQQLLCYKLAGRDMYITDSLVAQFRKGSSPRDWQDTPDIALIKSLMTELPVRLAEDYAAGKLTEFPGYQTSTGPYLGDIDAVINFNNFHEGLHYGTVLALKRLLA